ncbi:MAG: FkbM family methyltransferase [bacterium]
MNYCEEEKNIKDILAVKQTFDKNAFLSHHGRTIIYGAGETGKRVRVLLERYGIKIDCFLDEKGGKNIFVDNIPVFKPGAGIADKTAIVIVAIFNHTTDIIPVIALLKEMGFTRIIPYTEFFIHFADDLPVHYWLGPVDIYKSHISEITTVFSMLDDRHSKELYLSLLRFRITGNPAYMPQPQIGNIYFPLDVPGRSKPCHFIDCGAFSGDTLVSARERFGILGSVRAFEPDQKNFRQLVQLNNDIRFSEDTVIIPCGVWSSTVQLRFASENCSAASSVSDKGDSIIQCVTLDDCLGGYKPTLIKMDVEGSELEALEGSRNMIVSSRPQLAVSVYHTPDHLWKIPMFIKEIVPDYKCFLRLHGANGYDTVFYAHI